MSNLVKGLTEAQLYSILQMAKAFNFTTAQPKGEVQVVDENGSELGYFVEQGAEHVFRAVVS